MAALTWSKVEARIRRAREALAGGQYTIRPVEVPTAQAARARATFAVRNGEKPEGDPYMVVFYEHTPTGKCTCADFVRHDGPACKHIAMVVLDRWPESFDRWASTVRELCAPEGPQPEPQPEPPPVEQVEDLVRRAVRDALSAMEEQITATIAPEVQGIVLGILARE
jgi:hypothetical protein